jgi:two-component system KDP operon response regulator KdpE
MRDPDITCVLVVEDDRNIVDLLRTNLVARGFDVIVSTTGEDALSLLETETPDIALVDLMLPRVDGFELCRMIRERSSVGILVLSARGGEGDKVRALNLTKPFGIDELLARILATLRRTRVAPTVAAASRLLAGDLLIDLENRSVCRGSEVIRLTPTEFALLRELVTNPGKTLSHAVLLRRVWGPGYATETEYTRVYIRRLRNKLEVAGAPALIATEPRVGYRFAFPVEPADAE